MVFKTLQHHLQFEVQFLFTSFMSSCTILTKSDVLLNFLIILELDLKITIIPENVKGILEVNIVFTFKKL